MSAATPRYRVAYLDTKTLEVRVNCYPFEPTDTREGFNPNTGVITVAYDAESEENAPKDASQ